MNTSQVIGNLVKDIELIPFQNGNSEGYVANGTLATNEVFGNKKKTSYIDFTVYNNKAEVIKNYCSKGTKIGIWGKLRSDTYEDKKGITRKKTYISVEGIDLVQKIENTPE
ncbi:single-stranded DNA-binding protein [Mammaliicoccus sp. D-M17]|uniref:single-stranded DNA-binding protein n=1 Tax=Mammaliicoccus sp. D-M17 TaxID=2898677 RepID=UPI001EFAD53B|nr:single-stranded DNA-binding protein [Mammaliicoccus sp. D-M17]